MNEYSLVGFLNDKLQGCESTLKKTSFDKENNEYLCNDESLENVYNFDVYIESAQIHFGLDELNTELGGFYDNVITQDVEYFKQHFAMLDC